MKKILTLTLFLVITGASISPAYSLDISLGLTGWYSIWNMEEQDSNDGGMDLKPAFLYGPLASFRFNNTWSLSTLFLYGKFTPENSSDTSNLIRYDSDTALNYNIFKFLKIFGGLKIIGFRWDSDSGDGKHQSIGPGLGIGVTLHAIGNLYFLGNFSGLYAWGSHEDGQDSIDMVEYGFNSNLSLAYYITPASTTITAGFRYQRFWTDYANNDSGYTSDIKHDFYGFTLAVIYSFSTSGDQEKKDQ